VPIINQVSNKYDYAAVDSCCESGCRLGIDIARHRIILKGEKLCPNQRICDNIIFVENAVIKVVLVEFKRRNVDVGRVIEKLENCSEMALSIIGEFYGNTSFDLCHVVISRSWRPHEYRILQSRRLTIRGRRFFINIKSGNCSLSTILQ
jgi:hypothetical protein